MHRWEAPFAANGFVGLIIALVMGLVTSLGGEVRASEDWRALYRDATPVLDLRYRFEQGNSHYGSEWDAGLFKKIKTAMGAFNLGIQYASYNADNFARDTDRPWLTLQFKLKVK